MCEQHRVNALRAFERHGTRTRSQVVHAKSSNFAFSSLVLEGALELVQANSSGALVYQLAGA